MTPHIHVSMCQCRQRVKVKVPRGPDKREDKASWGQGSGVGPIVPLGGRAGGRAMAGCHVCSETEVMSEGRSVRIIWGAGSHGAATKVGHVMVAPVRHVAQISDLTEEEMSGLVEAVTAAMEAAYSAWFTASSWGTSGLGNMASANVGFNYGPHGDDPLGTVGLEHLHVHIVPRNPNDTNFMWWSTRASILHIRDMPMRKAMEALLAQGKEVVNSFLPRALFPAPKSDSLEVPQFSFDEPSQERCPLCKENDALHSNSSGRVLFSIKPYKYGHVMVIPHRHVATLGLCTEKEVVELLKLVGDASKVVMDATGSDSYSVGINIGPHSGASIPSHLHIHIIPRYFNDGSVAYWPQMESIYGIPEKPDKLRDAFFQHFGQPLKFKPC